VLATRYGYDAVNRIASAGEHLDSLTGTTTWAQTYSYGGQFGNLLVSGDGDSPGLRCLSYDATNHCSGFGYDSAGNLTRYGYENTPATNTILGYDVENRQITLQEGSKTWFYSYDGEGHRVKKTDNDTTVVYVYDALGRLAAEYGGTVEVGGTEYLTSDHLGSTRLVTDSAGSVKRRYDYEPFGMSMNTTTGGRSSAKNETTSPASTSISSGRGTMQGRRGGSQVRTRGTFRRPLWLILNGSISIPT
jgi:YD repeat-containing protein